MTQSLQSRLAEARGVLRAECRRTFWLLENAREEAAHANIELIQARERGASPRELADLIQAYGEAMRAAALAESEHERAATAFAVASPH